MGNTPFSQWLELFKQLHERWKIGRLTAEERQEYLAGRLELARVLLASQKVQLPADANAIDVLRIGRALECQVKIEGAWVKGLTFDVGLTGFSVQQPLRPRAGDPMDFQLWLPGAILATTGHGKVAEVRRIKADTFRIALTFPALRDDDRKRLETMVFDAVISQMRLPMVGGRAP